MCTDKVVALLLFYDYVIVVHVQVVNSAKIRIHFFIPSSVC